MKMEVMQKLHKESFKRTSFMVKPAGHKSNHRVLDAMSKSKRKTERENLKEQCMESVLNGEDIDMETVVEDLILVQREHSEGISGDSTHRDEVEANHLVCLYFGVISRKLLFFQNRISVNSIKRVKLFRIHHSEF